VRLGGFVILPRILDKCAPCSPARSGNTIIIADRPAVSPFRRHRRRGAQGPGGGGKSDGEILEWIRAHSTAKPTAFQIAGWSAYQDQRAPADVESRDFFQSNTNGSPLTAMMSPLGSITWIWTIMSLLRQTLTGQQGHRWIISY